MAYAIGRVHTEAVRAALQCGNRAATPDADQSAMMRAAMIGHTAAVNALLDRGMPVDSIDQNGRTPLMEAAFGGHIDTLKALLDRGADINARDADGWTALMEASAKGRADVVRILLARGADARLKNKNGWSALRTTSRCNVEVTRLLRSAGAE